MKKLLLILSLVLITFAGEESSKALNFSAQTLRGKKFDFEKSLGKGPIVINFWATWCIPCAAEMEALKPIYKKYKSQGLQVISISADDAKSVGKVNSVVRTRKYPFTILLDPSKKVYNAYHLSDVPHSFLIDKDGNIVFEHRGYKKGDEVELEESIQGLLK